MAPPRCVIDRVDSYLSVRSIDCDLYIDQLFGSFLEIILIMINQASTLCTDATRKIPLARGLLTLFPCIKPSPLHGQVSPSLPLAAWFFLCLCPDHHGKAFPNGYLARAGRGSQSVAVPRDSRDERSRCPRLAESPELEFHSQDPAFCLAHVELTPGGRVCISLRRPLSERATDGFDRAMVWGSTLITQQAMDWKISIDHSATSMNYGILLQGFGGVFAVPLIEAFGRYVQCLLLGSAPPVDP